MAKIGARPVRGTFSPVVRTSARWFRRCGLTSAAFARIGIVLAVLAAVWLSEGGWRGAAIGSLLLAAILFTDAVGAELGGGRDALKAWSTILLQRLREYLIYAGLAVGGMLTGVPDTWMWATGAVAAAALRETALSARSAAAMAPVPRGGVPTRLRRVSPVEAADPSRPVVGRTPGDASLTAELLGGRAQEADSGTGAEPVEDRHPADGHGPSARAPRSGGRAGTPFLIRTIPASAGTPAGWEPGSEHALRGVRTVSWEKEGERGRRETRGAYPMEKGRFRLVLLRRILRWTVFGQAERFAVVAVTITIWDVRVTFIAVIIGCALAVAGAPGNRSVRDITR